MTPDYISLLAKKTRQLQKRQEYLSAMYKVQMNPTQIAIIAALDAHTLSENRSYTAFEQRQVAHMCYGYRG